MTMHFSSEQIPTSNGIMQTHLSLVTDFNEMFFNTVNSKDRLGCHVPRLFKSNKYFC